MSKNNPILKIKLGFDEAKSNVHYFDIHLEASLVMKDENIEDIRKLFEIVMFLSKKICFSRIEEIKLLM